MSHSGVALIDPHKIFTKVGLSAGMRVADMGCGRTGHFVFPAIKIVGDRGVIYAVDIQKDILKSIQSRVRSEGYENVHTVWSNIEKYGGTPVPEKSLDVCFYVNVMFALKNKVEALKEAGRLLKKDGFLVVVDWRKKIGPLGPSADLMVKPEELAELTKPLNLALIDSAEAGDYHFSLIFKKNA